MELLLHLQRIAIPTYVMLILHQHCAVSHTNVDVTQLESKI